MEDSYFADIARIPGAVIRLSSHSDAVAKLSLVTAECKPRYADASGSTTEAAWRYPDPGNHPAESETNKFECSFLQQRASEL